MLTSLPFSRRIPKWLLHVKAPVFSSSSCCSSAPTGPDSNPDQTQPSASAFEAKIQSLRHKRNRDSFVKVLHNTGDVDSALRIFKWASLQKGFSHTVHTYYWMILKLGVSGYSQEMEFLCQSMIRDGCPGAETALVTLIGAFLRHGRLNEATRLLVVMSSAGYKPGIDVFNLLLGALVEANKGFPDVVFVYKEMVKIGVAPNVDTLNFLIDFFFESGRVDTALDQYRRMSMKGCDPNSRTFEIVIRGLVANGKVDDSVAILSEMLHTGFTPQLSFYTSVIPLFCSANKLELGIRLFRMMKASNFMPDSVIYGALTRCLCKNLQLDDAMELLEQIVESNLTLSSDVLVDVVSELCKMGKTNEVMKLLKDKRVREAPPYNALLSVVCGYGNFLEAIGLLEYMSRVNIADSDSWSILIRWLCERREIGKASQLLGKMIVSSLFPNPATYLALVVGNCRSSKYDAALQLFYQIRAKCWVLDLFSYSELVEGLCSTKKYMEAVKVFCYMSENRCFLDPLSFHMLVKGICDSGMVKEAVDLLFRASCSGASIDGSTYSYLLFVLSELGNGKNLLAFLSLMLVRGWNLDSEVSILIRSMTALVR